MDAQQPTTPAEKSKYKISISDRWIVGLTAVIAFTGIVAACIFGEQLVVMQGQLDEMRTDTRAWLAPSRAEFQSDDVSIYFGNVGKSPILRAQIVIKELSAKDGYVHGVAAIYSRVENEVKKFCPTARIKEPLKTSEVAFILLPNEAINSYFPSAPDAYVRSIGVGKGNTGFVVGCMSYETAGETHHTAFCYAHSGDFIRRCTANPEAGYFASYAD